MRSIRHLTPRYTISRISEIYYQKTCPDHPWLTKTANTILRSYLRSSDTGLEFGSGRGTVWFGKRIGHLTSIEHNDSWYCKVRHLISENGLKNVDYHLLPKDVEEDNGDNASYVKFAESFNSNSLDFVLVDGIYRDYCVLAVLEKLRPGGVLVIDNVNWYLPSESCSPNSRTCSQGPNGEVWKNISESLSDWRKIWTSSGVTDTAFFFKPLR